MIYLDTSVALAHLLGETRHPPDSLWQEPLISSRLLQYECWTRLHASGRVDTHGAALRDLLDRVAFLEMTPAVLARAMEPFPVVLRPLDALHLASLEFLRAQGQPVRLASYDDRMCEAATRLGCPLVA